jgi:SAM-dependent methyltransferase
MSTESQLLDAINADLPPGIDWKSGARTYVQALYRKHGTGYIERHALTKPFNEIPEKNHHAYVTEATHYLANFTNTVALLNLPGGSLILDAGCGGGWISHNLRRMGYRTFGFDLCSDFIDLARRRVADDPVLKLSPSEILSMFSVHDIEADALPVHMRKTFDAAILESCLHHFWNPLTALKHIAQTIKHDGILVLIEGENRRGPIKHEYMAVMGEYHTLERPYPRDLLCDALRQAGFDHVEFVAPLHGWYSPNDPAASQLVEIHRDLAAGMNLAICAKTESALQRLFPWRTHIPIPEAVDNNAAAPLPPVLVGTLTGWLRRVMSKL